LRHRTGSVALVLAGLIGASLSAIAYWPGLMTWDTIRQYDQALSGRFDDWHPPAMEWLWRQLIPLHEGPMLMLLLQLGLFWGGSIMLALWAYRRDQPRLAIALVMLGFMPLSLALMGTVVKDSLMTGTLMAVGGLLTLISTRSSQAPGLRILGIALLVAAATLRFNAFLATVPLAFALVPSNWRDGWKKALITATVLFLMMAAALPVANRLLQARHSGVELSLVIYDLAGITENSGVDVFPSLGVANTVTVNHNCYNPVEWDSYSYWADPLCPIEFFRVKRWFAAHHVNPALFALRAIVQHPFAYAAHRLTHYSIATRFLTQDGVDRPSQVENPPNRWHYTVGPNRLLTAIDWLTLAASHTPLEWPCVWIALAVGALLASPGLPSRGVTVPIAMSAALYGLGYLAVSVASELRYYLWTILASAIANAIVLADAAGGAAISRNRLLLAYGPAVIILSGCLIWRLSGF
jgi:hypothetical protein